MRGAASRALAARRRAADDKLGRQSDVRISKLLASARHRKRKGVKIDGTTRSRRFGGSTEAEEVVVA
ncbi:hypothetical protein PCURB6_42970 [Paenibacillus curdlanolyticus]|nr:hypothetical protein PCURB6_42970 [Paenibacillus curdlanolyticus]